MIVHHFSDGLYAKETHISAGQLLVQHKHNYSHFGILAKGKVALGAGASIQFPGGGSTSLAALPTATTGITVANASTGVSGTNTNYQPYITVYMWKRTA